ncbi:MAG TPA: hypothetical protein ACFYD3_08210 [Candidatus Hypogeohydataceae bacterium YC41]
MAYTFRGKLCGFICPECPEPLSNVKVRLYRIRKEQNVTALAVANPKDTFAILTNDMVKAKTSSLIAETETDAEGKFIFELGEKQRYNGEAFEVDVYCGTVPHLKGGPNPPPPIQFSITTLQPMWRQTEQGFMAAWEYCLPNRYWCAVRARFGAWTICGRVITCDTKIPVMGVRVRAFDVDWIEDDPLGDAITDAAGKFRIDYLTQDFQKTPLSPSINIEWVSGPDLYFRVETLGGSPLLVEPRTKGRTPGRENVGTCFCVELCLEKMPPDIHMDTIPLFTNVGQYHVDPIYGDFTIAGLTTAGNYAFTDTIPLIGILPDGQNSKSLEYHFRVGEYNATGTVLGPVSDVDASMIAPIIIGKLEYWKFNVGLGVWELKADDYCVNNPGATHNVVVKPGGWIEVPRENELWPGGKGRFIPMGNLINLITNKLTDESFDLTMPLPALKAGDSVPPAKKSRAHTFKLFFEAREVGTVALLPGSNALEKIVFSNTHYTQLRHPNWAGGVTTQRAVVLLDILELTSPGAGCNKLQNHVHALYTVYHPFLGSARVYFEGNPPLPPDLPLVPVGGEAASGGAGHDFDITALKPCAYILWLEATLNLTSGWGQISGATIWDHIAFCKG